MVEGGDVIAEPLHALQLGAQIPGVEEQEQSAGYRDQRHQLARPATKGNSFKIW